MSFDPNFCNYCEKSHPDEDWMGPKGLRRITQCKKEREEKQLCKGNCGMYYLPDMFIGVHGKPVQKCQICRERKTKAKENNSTSPFDMSILNEKDEYICKCGEKSDVAFVGVRKGKVLECENCQLKNQKKRDDKKNGVIPHTNDLTPANCLLCRVYKGLVNNEGPYCLKCYKDVVKKATSTNNDWVCPHCDKGVHVWDNQAAITNHLKFCVKLPAPLPRKLRMNRTEDGDPFFIKRGDYYVYDTTMNFTKKNFQKLRSPS